MGGFVARVGLQPQRQDGPRHTGLQPTLACGPHLHACFFFVLLCSRADIFKEIDILISLKHENIVFMKGAPAAAAQTVHQAPALLSPMPLALCYRLLTGMMARMIAERCWWLLVDAVAGCW